MSPNKKSSNVLYANPEHNGLSFAVLMILVLAFIFCFILIQVFFSLLPEESVVREFSTVMSCIVTIPLAFGIAWLAEKYLKRIWHSGIKLMLGDAKITYHDGSKTKDQTEEQSEDIVFDLTKILNITRWYFGLRGYPRAGRERRVSSKWSCLACQLQQDDGKIIVFSYYPPEKVADWVVDQKLSEPFQQISLAQLYAEAGKKGRGSSTRPTISSSLLTGKEGRYWLAEKNRWQIGVELIQEDFTTLMDYLEEKTLLEA